MLLSFLTRKDTRELGTLQDEDPELFGFYQGAARGIFARIFGG